MHNRPQIEIQPSTDLGTVNEQDGEQSYQTNEAGGRNFPTVQVNKTESMATPTPNTQNISDMNPMLS